MRGVVGVHGGVKFYRGAAKAARSYLERDRSRADDYYLERGRRMRARHGHAQHGPATGEGAGGALESA